MGLLDGRVAIVTGSGRGIGREFALCFARDFSLQRMKSENVILLGSHRTNPWVEMVEDRMTFRFGFDMTRVPAPPGFLLRRICLGVDRAGFDRRYPFGGVEFGNRQTGRR